MKDPLDYGYRIGTAAEFPPERLPELIAQFGHVGPFVLWDDHSDFLLTGPDRDALIAEWDTTIAFPGKPFSFEGQAHTTH